MTLRLLEKYRLAFNQVRERREPRPTPRRPTTPLCSRAREADRVPWPVRDTALAIEFPRARDEVARVLKLRYDKVASVAIDRLLLELSRYIGEDGQPSYPELARHGTLNGYYTRCVGSLRRWPTAWPTASRSRSPTTGREPTSTRSPRGGAEEGGHVRYSLSPNWDEPTYRKRIDEALVGHPEVGRGRGPAGGRPTGSTSIGVGSTG